MSVELTPITRIEEYLDGIVNGGTVPQEDVTRIETFLDCIYNNEVCALTPVTRIETYLAKISGADVVLPDAPVTRIEMYLASIAGEDVVIPDEPVTRIEEYLAEWAEGGNIPWVTLTGAIVSFTAPRSHALKEVVVDIEPQQDLHGYDSPWPPGGGKNIADATKDVKFTLDTTIPIVPQASGTTLYVYRDDFVYTTEPSSGSKYPFCVFRDDDDNNCGQVWVYPKNDTGTKVSGVTLTGNATSVQVWSNGYDYAQSTGVEVTIKGFMIAKTEPSSWSPYSNECPISGWSGCEIHVADGETPHIVDNEYDVTWQIEAGTVYGGTLTVKEDGSAEVKGTLAGVDLATLTWALVSGTYGRWSANVPDIKPPTDGSGVLHGLAEKYRIVSSNIYNNVVGTMYCVPNGTTINICNGSASDSPSGKLVYELAEPITFTLSPQQVITALQGLNNVWANTGDVTVTFRGTPVVEPDAEPLQALNLLLGNSYHNNQTPEDVSDEEALNILLGGTDR